MRITCTICQRVPIRVQPGLETCLVTPAENHAKSGISRTAAWCLHDVDELRSPCLPVLAWNQSHRAPCITIPQ